MFTGIIMNDSCIVIFKVFTNVSSKLCNYEIILNCVTIEKKSVFNIWLYAGEHSETPRVCI